MVITPQAIIITVPPVGAGEMSSCEIPQSDQMIPSRKRRLAHLSLEEKIHRKKLKNRVAAQTSRDKKKARMEELENANALLSAQVVKLSDESEKLRLCNTALTAENESLKQQLKDAQATTAALLETLQNKQCSCAVSSLNNTTADLLADMGTEDLPDLCDLEHLAESLLQDALEIAAQEAGDVEQVVGQAPKDMESSRFGSGTCFQLRNNEVAALEATVNISPSNSSAMTCPPKKIRKRISSRMKSKLNCSESDVIMSDSHKVLTQCSVIPNDRVPSVPATTLNSDDCITIIIPSSDDVDSCVFLGEAVQEVTTTTSSYLAPPVKDEPLSPHSDITETVKSDCGYESLDSPHSDVSSTDMWNESFSELFPVLA